MKLSLAYNTTSLDIDCTGRWGIHVARPHACEQLPEIGGALRGALEQPAGSRPLGDVLAGKGTISVLISDLTRGMGPGRVLVHLLTYLEGAGIGPERVRIVCATGMHRYHSAAELASLLGAQVTQRYLVAQHDATDDRKLVEVGATGTGNRCLLNRSVVESDLVIVVGAVAFHYFAGYGGGRKLIVPGIAGEGTILANHRLSLKEDPGAGLSDGCRPGNLDRNPVHADMLEGARLVPADVFAVNIVSDAAGKVLFVNCGDLERSHREACRFVWRHFRVPLRHRYRAVIVSAGGFPRDINLLQSHKAMHHASYALEEGGIMLVAAACPEGIGSSSYEDAFANGRNGVVDTVRRGYTLNAQAAISTLDLTGRFSVYLHSELDDETVSRFGMHPFRAEDVVRLLSEFDPGEMLVLPDASSYLPYCRNASGS